MGDNPHNIPDSDTAAQVAEAAARILSEGRFGLRHLRHSERGAALSAVAAIDRTLEELLLARFIRNKFSESQLFRANFPLGSVAAKAHVAFMLGLITKDIRSDLLTITSIRNRFAHAEEAESFRDEGIRQEITKLKTFNAKEAIDKLPLEILENPQLNEQVLEQLKDGFVFEYNIRAILSIMQTSLLQMRNASSTPPDASSDKS